MTGETAGAEARPTVARQRADGPQAPDTLTLAHVNAPPAQTWNHLRVNDVSLEVGAPRPAGKVHARLPGLFSGVETGVGEEAAGWVIASAGDARLVEVGRGQLREEPIVVSVGAGEVADVGVLVREGATARVAVVARGAVTGPGAPEETSATLVRVIAERGAQVSVSELVAAGEGRQHIGGIGIVAGEDARIELRQYALGGARVALGVATELAGDRSRLDHATRYLVDGDDLLDVNHVVRQRGRSTLADVRSSGVLAGRARKTMRETIDLVHGAKGASGAERETVLMAGEHATNRTLPTILCDEDDVAGSHGASIGSVSPDQLAYLRSRGVGAEALTALFERALFDDVALRATDVTTRSAALERAEAVLGAEVARDIAEGVRQDGDRRGAGALGASPRAREEAGARTPTDAAGGVEPC